MYVGALPWATGEFLFVVFLCDLADQTHPVQWQLVLPGRALHHRREEGLRVEEARYPDGDGKDEVRGPALQLVDPEEQVGIPGRQAVQGSVGQLRPGGRNLAVIAMRRTVSHSLS